MVGWRRRILVNFDLLTGCTFYKECEGEILPEKDNPLIQLKIVEEFQKNFLKDLEKKSLEKMRIYSPKSRWFISNEKAIISLLALVIAISVLYILVYPILVLVIVFALSGMAFMKSRVQRFKDSIPKWQHSPYSSFYNEPGSDIGDLVDSCLISSVGAGDAPSSLKVLHHTLCPTRFLCLENGETGEKFYFHTWIKT